MRIDFLDRHPALVRLLATWHHAQWRHLYADWTLQAAATELATHGQAIPTTLVLFEQGQPLGSVSLVLEDAKELDGHGCPWLANLYVCPEARGRGLGKRLVHAATAHAAAQGVGELFLFTPEHAGFYEQLGWRKVCRTQLKGTPVDLMRIVPDAAGAAA